MKQSRRIISLTLTILFVFTSFIQPITSFSFAQGDLIYEEKTSEKISSGVTRENIKRFLTSGWLNINVITVDLSNPYVKLDLLTSPDGVGTLENIKVMAESSKAIAAVNADFFDKIALPSKTNIGYPIAFEMKAGEYVSSAYYNKNVFATFSMDNLKNILYSYVANSITLISPNGTEIKASDINKYSTSYKIPVIYNKYWGKYSIGTNSGLADIVEMVVNDNVVTEIRSGMPPIEIPENGYVVTARLEGAQALTNNFVVGDQIQLEVATTPDLSAQEFAVSGDTLLLRNGQVSSFSHNVSGLHPRTAIGTSADNRYLYIAAVDGRQTLSRGVSLDEMAAIMKEIGCYNAINFDGGGSTQMVERLPGTNNIGVVNSPSENPLRKVVSGLGVISTAPQGSLAGLLIDTVDTNIFVNTTREFKVKGFDEHYNPVEINQSDVTWKISGVKGYFNGNVLTAQEAGEAVVTASIDGISQSFPISILSSPVEIDIYPRDTTTSVGKTIKFKITGKNKNGYSAVIDPTSLNWKESDSIGTFLKNEFTVASQGGTIISCTLGGATAFARVTAAGNSEYVVQPCEEPVITYKSYPVDIPGDASLSYEQVHSGSSSYKLTYDFSTATGSRASYIVFPENSINIGSTSTDLGVWVYNDSPKTDWLKAQIVDAEGSTHLLDLSKDLGWTGWKFVKIPVDNDEIAFPAQLSRIYVVQIDPEVKSAGAIYIDDLTLFTRKAGEDSSNPIPDNIVVPDSANKAVSVQSSSNSFKFIVTGNIQEEKSILDKLYLNKLKEKINYTELLAVAGTIDPAFKKTAKKPIISTQDGLSISTHKNSTFIVLNDSKSSIRLTNPAQWNWLESKLQSINSNNIFIMLPIAVSKDTFSDPYEAELFYKILSKYKKASNKNIWVISGGKVYNVDIEKGIRSLSCSGMNKSSDITTELDNTKYLVVSVIGNEVTYQIKNVF